MFVPADRADDVVAALPAPVEATDDQLERLRRDGQVRLWWDGTPVDVFLDTTEFHVKAAARARWEDFGGHELPFLSCGDLAVFKAFFDRTKDWADLEEMAAVGALDVDRASACWCATSAPTTTASPASPRSPEQRGSLAPAGVEGGTVRAVADDDQVDGDGLDEGPDPFEGLTLDDDFIRSASVVEESAEERLARLAAIDAEHKRLAAEREVRRAELDKTLRRNDRKQPSGRARGTRQRNGSS